MAVTMVQVWRMAVRVDQALVPIRMGVRLSRRIAGQVIVLVMLVMLMSGGMVGFIMDMIVAVALGEVKPGTKGHQSAGHDDGGCQRFAEQRCRSECSNERRGSVVGSRPRRSQVAQGNDEEDQTDAIT